MNREIHVRICEKLRGKLLWLTRSVSQAIIDEFARISPIAWSHIAFTGKYNFKKSNGDIDVDAMVNELEKHLKRHFWKAA